MDFCIAIKLKEPYFRTYTLICTPHYTAPEMLLQKGYGFMADIW